MAPRKSFLIRISPELWDDLCGWAGQELRSVNGQIEFLLRRAVDERKKGTGGAKKKGGRADDGA